MSTHARLHSGDDTLQSRLDAVYTARSLSDLQAAYDGWADSYDVDLVEKLHWNAPERASMTMAGHVDTEAHVLDVGAGTGLVGEALAAQGFTRISALDISDAMLAVAMRKGIYSGAHRMTLGEALDLPDAHFDAVIAVGVFTEGHAKPDSFHELIRIVKPGGHIVFTLRPDVYENLGFKEAQQAHVEEGRWHLVEESDFQEGFRAVQTRPYKIWVYRVA
jgi:predicted TPR repeat methyltransferase